MAPSPAARPRRLWRNVHLVIGIGAALLLIPIGLSGSLLVWHDALDAMLHPGRYAVSAGPVSAPSEHVAAARAALGATFQPVVMRYPESTQAPVTVSARDTTAERGARPRLLTVYLDPSTARVLDVADFRISFIGILHRFHENLTIPEYNGRDIVGWAGVAMLIMTLTGLYLWWPRNHAWSAALRWQTGAGTASRLHHQFGFWICAPLAVLSLTGSYLGFPQQGRAVLSSVAAMSPQQRGGFGAPLLQRTRLTIDQALHAALVSTPDARPVAIFLPTQQAETWRVQLRQTDELIALLVDDRSGGASTASPRLAGDRIAVWIRWIHDGSRGGIVWQVAIFLCGIFPTVLAITGVIIWLQRRGRRAATLRSAGARAGEIPQLGAAE